MAKEKKSYNQSISGEDVELLAQFTGKLDKVLHNKRVSYLRNQKETKEVSFEANASYLESVSCRIEISVEEVLLDNGAGLSTRYAHMTQTAVTAGEAVTAGQIIGYVGSTGDSTGNHLHFEVMQNGVRMNPLELVFAQ